MVDKVMQSRETEGVWLIVDAKLKLYSDHFTTHTGLIWRQYRLVGIPTEIT